MPIFSTTEHRIACGLPLGIFLLALVLFVHNGAFDSPSNRLKCWTPQEFTRAWDDYTKVFCSSSMQVRQSDGRSVEERFSAALSTPLFLLLVGLLLLVPVAAGLLLSGVLKLTRDPKNERAWLSVLLLLAARALLLLFAIVALSLAAKFPEEKLGFVASSEAAALLSTGGSSELLGSKENSFQCNLRMQRLGSFKTSVYNITCVLAQRTPLVLAELSVLATWLALIFYVTWAAVGFVLHALLVISPTVRSNAAKEGAQGLREDPALSMGHKELAL